MKMPPPTTVYTALHAHSWGNPGARFHPDYTSSSWTGVSVEKRNLKSWERHRVFWRESLAGSRALGPWCHPSAVPNGQCAASLNVSTLWDPMDCSPPGSSVHGVLQARMLEQITMPSSREPSQPRDWTRVSRIAHGFFTVGAAGEACRLWTLATGPNSPRLFPRLTVWPPPTLFWKRQEKRNLSFHVKNNWAFTSSQIFLEL